MSEPEDAGHPTVPIDLLNLHQILEMKSFLGAGGRRLAQPRLSLPAGAVVSPEGWGATSNLGEVSTNITPRELAVHYEATDLGVYDHARCASIVRGIERYHVDHQHWDAIAYSMLVCQHRYCFVGRGKGHRTAANGSNTGNQYAYAVCVLGGPHDPFTPTWQSGVWDAARWLGMDRVSWYPHHHYFNTQCPGPKVDPWMLAGHPDPGLTPSAGGTPMGYHFKLTVPEIADWGEIEGESYIMTPDGAIYASPGAQGIAGVNGQPYWVNSPHTAAELHLKREGGLIVATIEDTAQELFRPDGKAPFRSN